MRGRQPVRVQYYDSPCGEMVLASVGEALCLCDWNGMPCACRNKRRLARRLNAEFLVETSAVLEQAKKQLEDYFACRRKAFNIPLRLVGTDFQQQVWEALLGIPYGETVRRTRQTLWRAVQMLTQKLCCQTIHDCPKVVPLHYESEWQ